MQQTSTDVAETANNWLGEKIHQPNDSCSLVSWSQLPVYGQLLPGKFLLSAKLLSYLSCPVSSSNKILNSGTIQLCFYWMIFMVNRHNAKIIIKNPYFFHFGEYVWGSFTPCIQVYRSENELKLQLHTRFLSSLPKLHMNTIIRKAHHEPIYNSLYITHVFFQTGSLIQWTQMMSKHPTLTHVWPVTWV